MKRPFWIKELLKLHVSERLSALQNPQPLRKITVEIQVSANMSNRSVPIHAIWTKIINHSADRWMHIITLYIVQDKKKQWTLEWHSNDDMNLWLGEIHKKPSPILSYNKWGVGWRKFGAWKRPKYTSHRDKDGKVLVESALRVWRRSGQSPMTVGKFASTFNKTTLCLLRMLAFSYTAKHKIRPRRQWAKGRAAPVIRIHFSTEWKKRGEAKEINVLKNET